MQVTSKQTLVFRVAGQKDFVLRPTKHPVSAPEYIRGMQLYKLAASDGTIQEFVPVAPPQDPAVDDKANADADKAAADKADADAKAEADAKVKKAK
jgi:hypothetical protein